MFKVPDWEEDVPKSNINLRKNVKKTNKQTKQQKKDANPSSLSSNTVELNVQTPTKHESSINNIKNHAKKRKNNGQIINNKKNQINNVPLDISTVDTENADEMLLDAKKKKFYEPIKRDDIEDLLFKEVTNSPQTHVSLKTTGKEVLKIISKKSQKSKKNKIINKKNKPVPENELHNNVFRVNDTSNLSNNSDNANIPKQERRQMQTNKDTNGITGTNANNYKNSKKEKLKAILEMHSTRISIPVSSNKLRERMLDRLKAAQFRYLNEKLYTSSGDDAKQLFQSDPDAFHTYHQGYQQQLKKWPVNPLDVIVKRIQKMPKTHTIADMGCGEAALSKRIPHKVRSFDLVSTAPGVEICDMAHTPLLAESVDAAVYCLALMGTDLTQYLVEANRVLKMGGHLLIAEVESRFDNVDSFTKEVMKLGFKRKELDKSHKVFFFMEFVKFRAPPVKKSKLPVLTLKPCLYKRR